MGEGRECLGSDGVGGGVQGRICAQVCHWEADFSRGHAILHCSLGREGWVGKNLPPPHLHPRRSYMLSFQLGNSSSCPNTSFLQGCGLDYLGWGGRRPPGCTETSRKSKFYGLSPSFPSSSLPQVSSPRLAKPRQDSIMPGERETDGRCQLGCWLNSPFLPLSSHSQDAEETKEEWKQYSFPQAHSLKTIGSWAYSYLQ